MYSERLQTLERAYKNAARNNLAFKDANKRLQIFKSQSMYVSGIAAGLTMLDALIAQQEKDWQDNVLRMLEAEIMQDLAYIYPSDGYGVKLSARVLRGKVRIEAAVHSYFSSTIKGEVADTQGRLFQQIVSFAALISIMGILGVNTVYVDEAFSGVSKANITKVNDLLRSYQERGFNIILIAQDTSLALGIDANTLVLTRSLDNKTTVYQSGVQNHG